MYVKQLTSAYRKAGGMSRRELTWSLVVLTRSRMSGIVTVMEDEKKHEYIVLTANQVVAHNLKMARILRGWTQEKAAERLEPYLGVKWSKASYSAAERSVERPDRIRNFSADEILAFSHAFQLPITWFFLPPGPDLVGHIPLIATPGEEKGTGHLPGALIESTFGAPEGQARQQERLDKVLAMLPPEVQGRYMELVSSVANQAALASIRATTGDLSGLTRTLRTLADRVEVAQATTVDSMNAAIKTFVEVYYRREAESEPAADEGSR